MSNHDESSSQVDDGQAEELTRRFIELLKFGVQVEATSSEIDINVLPPYFDQSRINKAQEICSKYYTNLSVASTAGLILLLQIESIAIPLLKTGKSRTVPDLYDRYSATGKYIKSCYETKFYEQDSDGRRCINLVRSMHQRGFKMMNDDPAYKREGKVWFNQYDMAMTQFAFIGLFLIYPRKNCAYHVKDEELGEIAYFWRVLSYYFGVEERFNIFVYHDDLERQREYMKMILNHQSEILASDRLISGLQMAKGFMLAFEDLAKETSFNILDHWWSPEISLSGEKDLPHYTLSDKWKLLFFNFYFRLLFRNELIMSWLNGYYKRKFVKFCESRDKIKKKLARRHKDFLCEL